jgi:hypothetical protein
MNLVEYKQCVEQPPCGKGVMAALYIYREGTTSPLWRAGLNWRRGRDSNSCGGISACGFGKMPSIADQFWIERVSL